MYPYQESNPDPQFRRLLHCPLCYKGKRYRSDYEKFRSRDLFYQPDCIFKPDGDS